MDPMQAMKMMQLGSTAMGGKPGGMGDMGMRILQAALNQQRGVPDTGNRGVADLLSDPQAAQQAREAAAHRLSRPMGISSPQPGGLLNMQGGMGLLSKLLGGLGGGAGAAGGVTGGLGGLY